MDFLPKTANPCLSAVQLLCPMVFCLGHSHLYIFTLWTKMQRCNGENAKLRRQTRSEKTEWRSAKMRRRRNDINIALSHSHLRIFVFAFLSLFRSITYNFIQVSFSPKLFRMILFVFSAHAPASVAAIVLAIKHH